MKRKIKKLSLKKQTLHLLNGNVINIGYGGAASGQYCSVEKACPPPSAFPNNCVSLDTRCKECNGLM
ncbi:MAG: hypothetical protein JNM68_07190 [Dinghuibacter sp.]|nr:hypothetical protein [Dinghuibacter sp.]